MEFLFAYVLTLILETSLAIIILSDTYPKIRIVFNSIIANTITLPFVWFFFPFIGFSYLLGFFISELFAIILESFIYQKLFSMRYVAAFKISLICNAVSLSVGLMCF